MKTRERLMMRLETLKKEGVINCDEITILYEEEGYILFAIDGYIWQYTEEGEDYWIEWLVDCRDDEPLTIEEVEWERIWDYECWMLL